MTIHERFVEYAYDAYVKAGQEKGGKLNVKEWKAVLLQCLGERFTPSGKPLTPEFDERVEEIRLAGTKIDAKKTREAIQKQLDAGYDPEEMKQGWKEYCEISKRWMKSKQEFICRPPSFFNGLRWMDDRKEWEKWVVAVPRPPQGQAYVDPGLPEPEGWTDRLVSRYPEYEKVDSKRVKRMATGELIHWAYLKQYTGLQEELI